jgi:hypothetical protein
MKAIETPLEFDSKIQNKNKKKEIPHEAEFRESQTSEKVVNRSDIEKDSFLLQLDNLLLTFGNKLKNVYLKKHLGDLIDNIIMKNK